MHNNHLASAEKAGEHVSRALDDKGHYKSTACSRNIPTGIKNCHNGLLWAIRVVFGTSKTLRPSKFFCCFPQVLKKIGGSLSLFAGLLSTKYFSAIIFFVFFNSYENRVVSNFTACRDLRTMTGENE
jgi:hypothetical protein